MYCFSKRNQGNCNGKARIYLWPLATHSPAGFSVFTHLQLIYIFREATHGTVKLPQTRCWFEGSLCHVFVNLSFSWTQHWYKILAGPYTFSYADMRAEGHCGMQHTALPTLGYSCFLASLIPLKFKAFLYPLADKTSQNNTKQRKNLEKNLELWLVLPEHVP